MFFAQAVDRLKRELRKKMEDDIKQLQEALDHGEEQDAAYVRQHHLNQIVISKEKRNKRGFQANMPPQLAHSLILLSSITRLLPTAGQPPRLLPMAGQPPSLSCTHSVTVHDSSAASSPVHSFGHCPWQFSRPLSCTYSVTVHDSLAAS